MRPLEDLLGSDDQDLVNLIRLCLTFDPLKRPKIEEVLEHPYFAKHHDLKKEPKCVKKLRDDVRLKKMH